MFAAGVTFEQPRGFYGSARLRHFGPRPLSRRRQRRVRFVARSQRRARLARRAVDLRVDVLNFLDTDDDDITYFYASRLPGEPVEGVEDLHFHPIEPRTVRAHVSWKF